MVRLTGYRCDGCGTVSDDRDDEGDLPIGWYRVQHKVHGGVDDYADDGHFCSERCMLLRMTTLADDAATGNGGTG